jgi:hypothetical protein
MTRFTMPTRERMKQPPKPAPKKKAFPTVREASAKARAEALYRSGKPRK